MKRDRLFSAAVAMALGSLLSLGSLWAVGSAFGRLTILDPGRIIITCVLGALCCGGLFQLRRGGALAALAGVLGLGWLWHGTDFPQALSRAVWQISWYYDQAYSWGTFYLTPSAREPGAVDLVFQVWGICLAAAAVWTVVKKRRPWLCLGLSGLTLGLCFVVTDTPPDTEAFFLLLLCWILLLLTSRVRRHGEAQANRLTLLAAVPTALALAGLFLLLPQDSYVNQSALVRERIAGWFLDLPAQIQDTVQDLGGGYAAPGEPAGVSLEDLGRRKESDAVVMYVTADVGGTLYLRGRDYDLYDGGSWSASDHRVEEFRSSGPSLGRVTIETRQRMAEVYLPYYPAGGQSLIGGRLANSRMETAYTYPRWGLPPVTVTEPDTGLVAGVGDPREGDRHQRYTALPENTRRGALALLEDLLPDGAATEEKARAIAGFVRGQAQYRRDPSRMPAEAGDFALWFLSDAEYGYCVHFASSAVVLLRAAGIEARYVSGYAVTLGAEERTAVTWDEAHAWAEYFDPGRGCWVILEATPGMSGPREEAPLPEETQVPLVTQPKSTLPRQEGPVTEPTFARGTGEAPPAEEASGENARIPPAVLTWLLIPALVLGLVVVQRRVRRALRRKRLGRGSPNAQALARWQECRRLGKLLGQAAPGELEELALKAKFSQHTLTPEELGAFDRFAREARKALMGRKWYKKWVYYWIYAV